MDTVQRKRLVYKAENAEIVEKRELDELTEESSFDRYRRCYTFARYTDTPTRAVPIRHPSTAHEPQTCEAPMQTVSQTGEGVHEFCSSSSLDTSEPDSSRIAQRKSIGLRFKSGSATSFTGYVSIFCLAKASAWLNQHHLPPITGRCLARVASMEVTSQ